MSALIGREDELAAIAGWLALVPDGLHALTISGDAGIGKTRVWHEAVALARRQGMVVLESSPAQVEAKLAYAGLSDLFDDVPPAVLKTLPPPQERALAIALLREEAGTAELDARTVSSAALSTLRALARAGPVVVAVDDAHWLDRPTARALEFALRRLDLVSVGVLASLRVESGVPGATFVAAIPPERTSELRLGPLPRRVLQEVVAVTLGRALPRPVVGRLDRASGGNPFYALELARALLAAGERDATASLAVPADLERIVRARLRRLPAATRKALLTAAAASSPTAELVGLDALAPAEKAGVVRVEPSGRVSFVHPLFAESVYASAASIDRRAAHARLAELVEQPEERATHLALAVTAPDENVARTLEAAARLGAARGAPDAAASLLVRAADLTPPRPGDGEAWRRRLDAAEYHFHAGEVARARSLLEQVLRSDAARPSRARALRLLAEVRLYDSSIGEALEVLPRALEASAGDLALRAVVEMDLAYALVQTGAYDEALPHARAAVVDAEDAGAVPGLLAETLAVKAVVEFFAGMRLDEAALKRALELEDVQRFVLVQMRPSMIVAILAWFTGDLDAARVQMERLARTLAERGEDSPFLLTHLAGVELQAGALDVALRRAREARQAAAALESNTFVAFALAYEAVALAYLGDADGASAAAAEATDIGVRTRFAIAEQWARLALGVLRLSQLDYDGACDDFAPLVAFVEALEVGDPMMVFFLPDAIEALVGAGEIDRAAALAGVLEERGRALDRPWAIATGARCRGLVDAARGDLAAAAAALDAALVEHARLAMPLERARTLLVRGRVQRRLRRRRAAQESLAEAFELFRRCGAAMWAERASEELARIRVRRAPDDLSAHEQRVAQLVASGLTNREIAEQLFISPKTVEAHLGRIYRKLGIARRAQLPDVLAGRVAAGKHGETPDAPRLPHA